MNILVVDDSNTMRRIIKNKLLDLEIPNDSIFEAGDGIEALKILNLEPIKLVFLDWNMPKLNGYDMLVQMKQDDMLKNIPVIMVTSEGGKKEVLSAIKAGVADYIVKPFEVDVLQKKIELVKEKFNIL